MTMGIGMDLAWHHAHPESTDTPTRATVVAPTAVEGPERPSSVQRPLRGQSSARWRLLWGVRAIEPVPCRGAQGLWKLPPDVEETVLARYREGVTP